MTEIDLTPPVAAAKAAEQGLKLRKEHKRGGTRVGVARAHQLMKREPLSADVVKRMASYFARHAVDKNGKDFDNAENPSAGFIAWQLWGGDAGRDWADKKKAELTGKG